MKEMCILSVSKDEWLENADEIQKITGLTWRSSNQRLKNLNGKNLKHFPVAIFFHYDGVLHYPEAEKDINFLINHCIENDIKYFMSLQEFLNYIKNVENTKKHDII